MINMKDPVNTFRISWPVKTGEKFYLNPIIKTTTTKKEDLSLLPSNKFHQFVAPKDLPKGTLIKYDVARPGWLEVVE